MSKNKFYVASSWRNEYHNDVIELLRRFGQDVYNYRNPKDSLKGFDWKDIDENWEKWTTEQFIKALNGPVADEAFKNDFEAMKWANTCILLLPSGRSAHTEAGWMKGAGKKVYVLSPDKHQPELMYKIYDGIYTNLTDLLQAIPDLSETCEVCKLNNGNCKHKSELPERQKYCYYFQRKQ